MNQFFNKVRCALWIAAFFWADAAQGATTVGTWTPQFKGVDYSVSTNTPGGGFPNLQVVHALRVDLTDPDIQLKTTPRVPNNYQNGVREVIGRDTSSFLTTHQLQAAINANFFSSPGYYPPPGTVFNIHGLAMDEGVVVSAASSAHRVTFLFDANKVATFVPTNWPAQPTEGVFTAVAGDVALVINGTNRMSQNNDVEPRTVFGLSADRRFLFLLAIDGRQPGYSNGASLHDCGRWLLLLGAHDGINMDGGGSTLLVVADSTGAPVRLNSSSAVIGDLPRGRERVVGSHLGLYAKPLPGFINDVEAIPDDTLAVIKWTTIESADSSVRYGLTTDLELGAISDDQPTGTHQISLTGLTPATSYYFQVLSATEQRQHASAIFAFTTTNYVSTNQIFEISQPWKYTGESKDGVNWMAVDYDDSNWSEPGPGVLWVDTRTTPLPAIPEKATRMSGDPTTGFPYVTHYFRTSFVLTTLPPGSALEFSGYIDDGAVVYLNGVKSYLLRVPDDATSSTLADAFPCGGDAVCLDQFTIPASSNTNLVVGTNVVAVEVHNYNPRSPDITFGLALARIEPLPREIKLQVGRAEGKVLLEWSATAALQSAPNIDGPWEDVTPTPASPALLEPSASSQFYRLRR